MSNHGFYSFNRITGLYCTSIDLFLALDLLGNLLLFNPDRRISAEDALDHIFLAEYSCPEDEPIALRSFHVENEVRIGQGPRHVSLFLSEYILSILCRLLHSYLSKLDSISNFVK